MRMADSIYYSAEMVRALPEDGNRYETVHGELLVTPAPSLWHQIIVKRFAMEVETYVRAHPIGFMLHSPADISWSDDTLVQPDLFVADLGEIRTLEWANVKTLLLAVEVLSPSTARYDRFTKRRLYQEARVATYWVVDPDRQTIEVWTPDAELPEIERERVVWHPAGASEALEIEVKKLFEPI